MSCQLFRQRYIIRRVRIRIIGITLFFLVGYTVIKAVEILPSQPWLAVALALGIFVLIIGWQWISHHPQWNVNDKIWYRVLAWCASEVMSFWSIFIPLSFVTDLIYLFVRTGLLEAHARPLPFSMRSLEFFMLTVTAVMTIAGYIIALAGPKVRDVTVPIEGLPADLNGLKIAQISDLHVGSTIRRRYVERVVARANAVQADLVTVTGDLLDGWAERLTEHLNPLSGLQSRHGVYYVTGNHEYYWDAHQTIDKIKQFGFVPLINESVPLKIGETHVLVSGITDPAGEMLSEDHIPDVARAARMVVAAQAAHLNSDLHQGADVVKPLLRVLLSHRPDVYREAEEHGFHLQLSGHTHGGQYFPYNLMMRFFHKFHRGLHQYGRLAIYVNPGSGYWAPANRLGVPAEISVITLISRKQ